MKKVLFVLVLAAAFAFAIESCPVEDPLPGTSGTDAVLQYDDGTAAWIWSGLLHIGPWFDVTDFDAAAVGFDCNYTEWWFYHHATYPWDTDLISGELWTGDAVTWPVTNLTADTFTALHYAPAYVLYSPAVSTGTDFWMIANTTIHSTLGRPSALYDGTTNFTGVPHTFYSQDWVLWNTVNSGGIDIDVFFRVEGLISTALERSSWAAIKGLFR
ncbi:MAG: hypothetical protein KAT09_02095 [Candidatus Aegiribacteria sp.]|nr:hypothetical protein [Candidatus Aegiribacteria sp.]